MRRIALTGSMFLMLALGGCAADTTDDIGTVSEDLSLVECDRDDMCDRGEVCLFTETRDGRVGQCSTGDRCDSSRDCPEASVCRGGDGYHCMVVERDRGDAPERDVCPRGSTDALILCAPGFDHVMVTRECATCEPNLDVLARCRAAGIEPARCRSLLGGGGEHSDVAARCDAAGIEPERCRHLVSEDHDGRPTADRCRAAGISAERCRALVSGEDEGDRSNRCIAAGIAPERCRALLDDTARDAERGADERAGDSREDDSRDGRDDGRDAR